jgi:hypothetical protein
MAYDHQHDSGAWHEDCPACAEPPPGEEPPRTPAARSKARDVARDRARADGQPVIPAGRLTPR